METNYCRICITLDCDSPNCFRFSHILGDPEHLVFHCIRFPEMRNFNEVLERSVNLKTIVAKILRSMKNWLIVSSAFINTQRCF